MSRIRRVAPPIRWNAVTASVTQGVANQTIKLASFLTNSQNRTVTYSVATGTLPTGLTLNATTGVITYDGASPVAAASVQFRATTGAFSAETPFVTVSIGTNAGSQPGTLNVTLGLTNGGADKPWTFGHAFKKGNVPSGQYLLGSGPTAFQADIRNRWADGSVRFAVLSGIGGTSCVITTVSAPVNSGSTNVSEPSAAAVSGYAITFTGDGAGTYGIPVGAQSTWARGTASKVRQILGPVMSEFHYYQPTSDAHLALWFYVRAYSTGAIEVEVSVENGWTEVAGPGARNYSVSVSVGGTQIPFANGNVTQSVTHLHHTRWGRIDWITADPLIDPVHDTKYLVSTQMLPNYDIDRFPYPATAALFSAHLPGATRENAFRPVPFESQNGNFNTGAGKHWMPSAWAGIPVGGRMGGGGWNAFVGPTNHWDAIYLTSRAAAPAYYSVMWVGNALGCYGLHYKSETSGRPPTVFENNWGAMTLHGGNDVMQAGGDNAASTGLPGFRSSPTTTGIHPPRYSGSHSTSWFMAYFLTGRWPKLENNVNQLTAHQLAITTGLTWPTANNKSYRFVDSSHNSHMSRTMGWMGLKAWGYTSALYPQTLNSAALPAADQAIKTYTTGALENQIQFMHDTFVTGTGRFAYRKNLLGAFDISGDGGYHVFLGPNINETGQNLGGGLGPYLQDQTFMNFVITLGACIAYEIEPDISTTKKSQLYEIGDYGMLSIKGLAGSNEFNWRYCNAYDMAFGKATSTGNDVARTLTDRTKYSYSNPQFFTTYTQMYTNMLEGYAMKRPWLAEPSRTLSAVGVSKAIIGAGGGDVGGFDTSITYKVFAAVSFAAGTVANYTIEYATVAPTYNGSTGLFDDSSVAWTALPSFTNATAATGALYSGSGIEFTTAGGIVPKAIRLRVNSISSGAVTLTAAQELKYIELYPEGLVITDDRRDLGLPMCYSENPTVTVPTGYFWVVNAYHNGPMAYLCSVYLKNRGGPTLAYDRLSTSISYTHAAEQAAIKTVPNFGAVVPRV